MSESMICLGTIWKFQIVGLFKKIGGIRYAIVR